MKYDEDEKRNDPISRFLDSLTEEQRQAWNATCTEDVPRLVVKSDAILIVYPKSVKEQVDEQRLAEIEALVNHSEKKGCRDPKHKEWLIEQLASAATTLIREVRRTRTDYQYHVLD